MCDGQALFPCICCDCFHLYFSRLHMYMIEIYAFRWTIGQMHRYTNLSTYRYSWSFCHKIMSVILYVMQIDPDDHCWNVPLHCQISPCQTTSLIEYPIRTYHVMQSQHILPPYYMLPSLKLNKVAFMFGSPHLCVIALFQIVLEPVNPVGSGWIYQCSLSYPKKSTIFTTNYHISVLSELMYN